MTVEERKIKREARKMIKQGITDPGKARLIMHSLSFMLDDEEAQELARLLQVQWQKWCELRPDFFERRERLWSELAEKYGFKEADRILDEKINRGEI
jgi:siroheme synthase (precorrin-2 oxidase/ferrochelatase)